MTEEKFRLKIGLPSGSLEKATLALFAKAGWKVSASARSYKPVIDDPELEGHFLRSQEISMNVEMGHFDCGLCGYDWVVENGSDVVEVCELPYSKASNRASRWVLVVPESSAIRDIEDLKGKRIATELVGVTQRYLETKGIEAKLIFPFFAFDSISGPPGYDKFKSCAILSNASPKASSRVSPSNSYFPKDLTK